MKNYQQYGVLQIIAIGNIILTIVIYYNCI